VLGSLDSQAVAATTAPASKPPKTLPPPMQLTKPGCRDSGLGGPICPFKVFLTKDQFQMIQQFHEQNLRDMQNTTSLPK
jgi:hypothetical protein